MQIVHSRTALELDKTAHPQLWIPPVLAYLGRGPRRYDLHPLRVGVRPKCEFQAVIRGRIAPLMSGERTELHSRCLWVFPPGVPHGWSGEPRRVAEVAVFHFSAVPAPVRALFSHRGTLAVDLSAASCARLRRLAREAEEHLRQP